MPPTCRQGQVRSIPELPGSPWQPNRHRWLRAMIRLFAPGAMLMAMLIPFCATAGPNRVFETGNDLYEACTNPFNAQFCQGFVSAVADVMGTTQIEGFAACI